MKRNSLVFRPWLGLLVALLLLPPVGAGTTDGPDDKISLSMRDMALSEVMDMLSRQKRVNILLSNDVEANVSFSLYEVTLDEAIGAIASAAGYAVEKRSGSYFIVEHDAAGRYAPNGLTEVRSFEIQYADTGLLEDMLSPYLSDYGELRILEDRRLVVVEDTPEFMARIARLLTAIDRKPRQILIEAQILEITLDDEDAFGIDWKKLFDSDGGSGSFGTTGLSTDQNNGFFFDLATPDIEVALDALRSSGRVRTLSTPKLLALENQESEVLIGDRKGYRVTTTINQVTSESIEFLESGVILRVTPSIDSNRGVMLDIHPEVSTGSVDASGIPSQTTTEVTTRLLVSDGQSVFIGGLLKHTLTESRAGVPVLGNIPGVKRLFSNRRKINLNTETIVLITPHIVDDLNRDWNTEPQRVVKSAQAVLHGEEQRVGKFVTDEFPVINSVAMDSPETVWVESALPSGHPAAVNAPVQRVAPVDQPERTEAPPAIPRATPNTRTVAPETSPTATEVSVANTETHMTASESRPTTPAEVSTPPIERVIPTHRVNADALRVRFRPHSASGVRTTLYYGDQVRILNHTGDWSEIRYSDADGVTHDGWSVSDYFDPI